jgi:DNA-binding response OmpR family regulator
VNSSQEAWVLLVEDNPGDALLVEEALTEHRVTGKVVVLGDGEKAIQFVEELEAKTGPYPGLVILDLNLPKRTGTDVLRRVRESALWNHVPVVMLTSSNAPRDRQETARLGANLYILKPGNLDEFLEIGAVLKSFLMRQ